MTPEPPPFTADLSPVRERLRQDRPHEAARLLARLWEAVPEGTATAPVAGLRAATEELGRCATASPEIAAVLRRANRCYARNGHHRLAHWMGIHELAVWRARAASESTLREQTLTGYRDALHALARIDRALGRLHDVADGLDELLELQLVHGLSLTADAAWTLRELGAVMLEGGRPDTVIQRYLRRADDIYAQLDKAPTVTRQRAVCHVLSGQAHWNAHRPTEAWLSFNRARTLLQDADPEAAAEIRTLMDAMPAGGELPRPKALVLAEFGLPAWPAPTWPGFTTT